MCTIIVLNQHHKEFPLIIAANRDEKVDRESTPVGILADKPHLIIGGRDEVHGGTWLGVNKYSLFAAVTNQGKRLDDKESRGQLVMDVLKCTTVNEMLSMLEDINPVRYNHFNLVFGNTNNMYVAHSYLLHSLVIHEIPKGVSTISNDMIFGLPGKKVQFIHKKLDGNTNTPWVKYYTLLKGVLRNSSVISKDNNYKTRSSAVLAFDKNGLARYKFVDRGEKGVKYKDYIDLFRGEVVENPKT